MVIHKLAPIELIFQELAASAQNEPKPRKMKSILFGLGMIG